MAEKENLAIQSVQEIEKPYGKSGDNFGVGLVAVLKGKDPGNKEVKFIIAGSEKIGKTNDKGETPLTRIDFSTPANEIVGEVKLVGNDKVRKEFRLTLPRSQKAAPKKLKITVAGPIGPQKQLIVTVKTLQPGVKKFSISCRDQLTITMEEGAINKNNPDYFFTITTTEDGVAQCRVSFRDSHKVVTIFTDLESNEIQTVPLIK